MNIKVLLIDDDFKACDNLRIILSEHCPEVEVIGEAYNLKNAVEIINSRQPDLLFLDMQLDGEFGFDLFNLTDLSQCKIIVVSAFEDFALKAFQFSAIDYLLKPIDSQKLTKAVARLEGELSRNKTTNSLKNLLDNISHTSEITSFQKVGIPTVFGYKFIYINNIIRCEAERNYTKLFLKEGYTIMSSKNLSEIQSLLPAEVFVRVHHSSLINLNYIKEYHKGKQAYLIMEDEAIVKISQNKKNEFLKRIS